MRRSGYQARKSGCGSREVLLLVLLAGCTAETPLPEVAAPVEEIVTPAPVALPAPAIAKTYPVEPFEGDELYDLLVGEIAAYRGDYEESLNAYLKAAVESGDAGVAARAARLAQYLRKAPEAIQAAIIWAEADPDALAAHSMLVQLMTRTGEVAGAIEHLAAVKRLGGLADIEMFVINSEAQGPETRAALLEALDQMLVDDPDDEQLHFGRAVLLMRAGKAEEALAIVESLMATKLTVNWAILKVNALRALDRNDEVVTFLEAALPEIENNQRLRLHYAQKLFEERKLDLAQEQYALALEQDPQDGNVLFALALIAMEQKDDDQARARLSDMVRWGQRAGEAHYYLGSIAERNKDIPLAIQEYRQAGAGYEFLPSHARVAALLLDQGRLSDARSHLAKMRQSRADVFDELVLVEAQLLADRGYRKEVLEFMEAILAADPDNTDFLYFRAMTGQRFGDLTVLERDLRRVIELEPDNATALNALGYTLADQTDRHEEAYDLISQALAIRPDEAAFIDSLGWVQYRLENFDEAISNLRRALVLFPNDEVAAHLGEVLWITGAEQEADRVWQEALERAPESQILQKVMQRLKARTP